MKKTRRTEITIETRQFTIIHRHQRRAASVCPRESGQGFSKADELEAMLQVDTAEFDLLETAEDGQPLICGVSLGPTKNEKPIRRNKK